MSTLNGSSLFAGIYSGLTSTYSLISSQYPGSVTLENIASAMTNTANANSLNPTFASYLQTNFSALDSNRDGKLSSAEMSKATSSMLATGLTQYQLTQLGSASGMSTQALSDVLEHFADIDSNGDGKVTTSEITAFNIKKQEEQKKTEFSNRAATNMSVFYGDDDSEAAAASSSSLLDYKYGSSNNNNNS